MTRRSVEPLRSGWTTGACATAAAAGAYEGLLTGVFPDHVTITLPRGQTPTFALAWTKRDSDVATAAVIKDAGDDPDVTHGAAIVVSLRRIAVGSGIVFKAGAGVGVVTKPGLPLAVGEAAINPVPRRMIHDTLRKIAAPHHAALDLEVTISVPGGEALAMKTWNPRLGIMGGISILGTTGIVKPYSCSAWVASIHRGIDVCRANNVQHAAACTGSVSEAAVRRIYDLPDMAFLDMGDFIGALLKYLARYPLARLTLAGGFAKMSKFAAGHLDLHSGRSQIDRQFLHDALTELKAPDSLKSDVIHANTAMEIESMTRAAQVDLPDYLARLCRERSQSMTQGRCDIEVFLVDRAGEIIGSAP